MYFDVASGYVLFAYLHYDRHIFLQSLLESDFGIVIWALLPFSRGNVTITVRPSFSWIDSADERAFVTAVE